MKKPIPTLIGADAYPVFIMYEQLNCQGLLDDSQALDEIWEGCCMHYATFLPSKFNRFDKSEYDCIVDYVNSLTKPILQ